MTKTLLPAGCYDLLPPDARTEGELVSSLLKTFEAFGYEQVLPPLLEYTDSLLAGRGHTLSQQIFRVMDSGEKRVMGIRADMTMQIARIADTRLGDAPRPLRLSYAGNTLRMQQEGLQGERQLRQAGIELFGSDTAEADAEVILVAVRALENAGVKNITVDLNLPGLVGLLLASEMRDLAEVQSILNAVSHKDISAITAANLAYGEALVALVQATGAAEAAIAALKKLDIPDGGKAQIERLSAVYMLLKKLLPAARITVDATESRGFEYHSGISFSFFSADSTHEIGRGGGYKAGKENGVGFSLYIDRIRKLLPKSEGKPRVFVIGGITDDKAIALQKDGYALVFALAGAGADAAKKLNCAQIFENGKLVKV